VGKKISTKRAGSSRDFSVDMWNPDREDITDQYKYPEGTSEERAAVWRANEMSTKPTVYTEGDSQKVNDDTVFERRLYQYSMK